MRLGAWLRSGEVIGWLAAGIIPNSLYRVPFSYLFFWHVLCVIVPLFLSFLSCFCFVLFSCSRWSFVLIDVPLIFVLSSRPRTGIATTYITGYG